MTFKEDICNICGENKKGRSSSVVWGYSSFNKDGMKDLWHICYDCQLLLAAKFSLFCSLCGEKLRVVNAVLNSLSCSSFTAAVKEEQESSNPFDYDWIDSEWGKIGNWILCEPCYENFALKEAKSPIKIVRYDCVGHTKPEEEVLTENRIKKGLSQEAIFEEKEKYPRSQRYDYPQCPTCHNYFSSNFNYCPLDAAELNFPSGNPTMIARGFDLNYKRPVVAKLEDYDHEIFDCIISVPKNSKNAIFLKVPEDLDERLEEALSGKYCADLKLHNYPKQAGVYQCRVEQYTYRDEEEWRNLEYQRMPEFHIRNVLESEKILDID